MQTCRATTKKGEPCAAAAGRSGLCYFHEDPDRARSLGRVGGQKNRPLAIDLDVPDCMTATDLRKLTSGVIRKLAAGEIRGA
jgi:Family of unknown function (DUF5763)